MFDYRIEHRGRANTVPDTDRPLLYLSFAKRWYRDPRNHIDLDDMPSLFPKETVVSKACEDDNAAEISDAKEGNSENDAKIKDNEKSSKLKEIFSKIKQASLEARDEEAEVGEPAQKRQKV